MSRPAPDELPRPFLKWAGGKRQLLPEIRRRLPRRMATYHEPFLGGGAVFFALAREGAFERAVLADANAELIETYVAIRDRLEDVIELLSRCEYDEGFYYHARALRPADLDLAERAARTIYLNRAGFNGLYRLNKRGAFNVPFGRHVNPRLLDEPNLRAVSDVLQDVALVTADFEAAVAEAAPGDAVYFDPPYVPVSETSFFTAYDGTTFTMEEQARLAALMWRLDDRRVHALLSNSESRQTRELYRGLRIERVEATRAINSRADRRGPVGELLVRTRPGRRS